MSGFQVSIVRDTCVDEQVRKAINLIGGMSRFVSPGQRVLLKPNLTGPASWKKGVTTNPAVVETLMELSWEAGASVVDVGDGTGSIHIGTLEVMERCGLAEVVRKHGGHLVDLNLGPMRQLQVKGGLILKQVQVNQTMEQYDVIINIPVLKTHFITDVSLGMKNMKGCIPPIEKRRFHDIGVNQAVADLNMVIKASLTVVDGTVAAEGLGPKEGKPVGFQTVLAGENILAVDMAAASVMGFDPLEISHIRMAAEHGIGPSGLDEIEILGADISEVQRTFQRALPSAPLGDQAVIENYQACSGCIGCAAITVSRLKDMGFFEGHPERKLRIVIGTKVPEKSSGELPVFFIGNCTRIRSTNGVFIQGCAPSALDTANEILRYYHVEDHPDI